MGRQQRSGRDCFGNKTGKKKFGSVKERILMYLLDSDTIIYSMKGVGAVKENLLRHYYSPMKISVVTLMELYYGAYKSQKIVRNLAKIKKLEQSFEIIQLDIRTLKLFGILKARLEKKGTPLDDFDLIIASCACVHRLTLVTNNTKHFRKIKELKITNWAI
jgi:tRNA(fMet)-specific endonuclease VapC